MYVCPPPTLHFPPPLLNQKNAVSKMPPDLYFLVRTVQLLRGISSAFELDFSLSHAWAPYAARTLRRHPALVKQFLAEDVPLVDPKHRRKAVKLA